MKNNTQLSALILTIFPLSVMAGSIYTCPPTVNVTCQQEEPVDAPAFSLCIPSIPAGQPNIVPGLSSIPAHMLPLQPNAFVANFGGANWDSVTGITCIYDNAVVLNSLAPQTYTPYLAAANNWRAVDGQYACSTGSINPANSLSPASCAFTTK